MKENQAIPVFQASPFAELSSERTDLLSLHSPLRTPRFQITPLEKGGSGRIFYRIQTGEQSLIFVKYTGHREENLHYVDIARFLDKNGIHVPKIYHHDSTECLIWMQDLGEDDLWSFRDTDWSLRSSLYKKVLAQAVQLHTYTTTRFNSANPSNVKLQLEFSEDLYLWEQNYFFENCIEGIFGIDKNKWLELPDIPALQQIASDLARLPRCLIHRDFQSQNILIHDAKAWLIDFQGMRPGLPHYDLASLLYDPYVTLTEDEQTELIEFYKGRASQEGMLITPDFDQTLLKCGAQRLMQALGAYGFLGLKGGRPSFLRYVPTARRTLREILIKLEGLDAFVELLDAAPNSES